MGIRKLCQVVRNSRFPQAVELPKGLELWGLFAADGAPIAVSDEEGVLLHDAQEMDLVTVLRQ